MVNDKTIRPRRRSEGGNAPFFSWGLLLQSNVLGLAVMIRNFFRAGVRLYDITDVTRQNSNARSLEKLF